MTAAAGSRHAPSLRVERDGRMAAVSSGAFEWIVHRRATPVAFLATSLAALGDGEELAVSVDVAAGASLVLTAQGPSSLLRTGRFATQRLAVSLGTGAHLTFLPWVTIPFPGARSCLDVDVAVDDGASLAAWDVLAAGRAARGESFEFEELRASWRITGPGGLLLDDRLLVRGADREEAQAMLGGRTHVGSLYLAGIAEEVLPLARLRAALDSSLDLAGASRPAPDLVVARALDRSADRLEQAFWPLVCEARAAVGQPALAPEVVARRWF